MGREQLPVDLDEVAGRLKGEFGVHEEPLSAAINACLKSLEAAEAQLTAPLDPDESG